MTKTAVLRIDCPDRKGLVPAVVSMLYGHGANITHTNQHQDSEAGLFYAVEWTLDGFDPRRVPRRVQAARRRAAHAVASERHIGDYARRIFVSQHLVDIRAPWPHTRAVTVCA